MEFALNKWSEKDVAFLKDYLYSIRDEQYKTFSLKMVKTEYNVIGVRAPLITEVAKQIAKGNAENFILAFHPGNHEEMLLKASVIGFWRVSFKKKIPHIKEFVKLIDNWAVCDSLALGLNPRVNELPEVLGFVRVYIRGTKEYERRVAVDIIMDYFLCEQYIDTALNILKSVKDDRFYVNMAIAASISQSFIKFPQKTEDLLKAKTLDRNVQNKAIQKIRESYKVSVADKERALQWRIV